MKILYPGLLLVFLAAGIAGQSPVELPAAPDIELLENKWRVEIRNPLLDEDPFRANNESRQSELDRKETSRLNDARTRQGRPALQTPARIRSNDPTPRDPWATYFYEVKIKNKGEKKIREIAWDYVFFEPETQKEVGRRQFISKDDIDSGKTKTLLIRTSLPPTNTVDASKSAKKSRRQYSEQIVIYSIEYADGTVWQAPFKDEK